MTTAVAARKPVEVLPAEQHAVAPVTPMGLLKIATEQGADLDKLKQLMDLQERWEANEAKKAFVIAMAEFKKNPPTIHKNKHANMGAGKPSYGYASLDNVCDQIVDALSKVGISHDWKTQQGDGKIRVTCVLTHVRGHSESTWLEASPDTSGAKNSIQAIGSTVSYLQRYTLLAACGLAVGDQDDDGAGAAKVSARTESGAEQQVGLPPYTPEKLAKDVPPKLAKGAADNIIARIGTKYTLTDEQKADIRGREEQ